MKSGLELTPDDLLITEQLYRREARASLLEMELSAYRELSALMTASPVDAIERFLELALELCPSAGSAGLSELVEEDGELIFRWTALQGAFAPFVGGSTPRKFSPCGLCLDSHHTILVDRPARVFNYFNDAQPAIMEGLIVPLYDTGKRPIGTLWIVSHNPSARFDATDARVMEQLAVQLVLAIKLRRKAALAAQLEATASKNEVLVREVRHRVKNMIQMASGLLKIQERAAEFEEARTTLRDAQHRLLVLASVYENLLQADGSAEEVDAGQMLRALAKALQQANALAGTVGLDEECEPLKLAVNEAVPLGLIANEAITNALKYASIPGRTANVSIRFCAIGHDYSLTVADDGPGLGSEARRGSLGFRLMRKLADQLRAKLVIDGSSGTTVSLRWSPQRKTFRELDCEHAV